MLISTCETQNDGNCEHIRVLSQHTRDLHAHVLTAEHLDLFADQLIECGTPGPSYTGCAFQISKEREKVQSNYVAWKLWTFYKKHFIRLI